MNFSVNDPILFVLSGIIVALVLGQSVYFLIKAWQHGKKIGMDMEKLKKVAVTAGIFTIAPAIAIVISVITLSKDLGLPLPWLRLSVVGSLSYETVAATNAESAMGLAFGTVENLTAQQYITIASVMTISILVGIWLLPLIGKKLLNGVINLEKRDKKWADIFQKCNVYRNDFRICWICILRCCKHYKRRCNRLYSCFSILCCSYRNGTMRHAYEENRQALDIRLCAAY